MNKITNSCIEVIIWICRHYHFQKYSLKIFSKKSQIFKNLIYCIKLLKTLRNYSSVTNNLNTLLVLPTPPFPAGTVMVRPLLKVTLAKWLSGSSFTCGNWVLVGAPALSCGGVIDNFANNVSTDLIRSRGRKVR